MTANDRAVRIIEIEPHFSSEHPDGTFAFGAATMNDLTLAHVRARVQDRAGNEADGWGAIFLSHQWAFPGPSPDAATKDALMRDLLGAYGNRLAGSDTFGHPIDHFLALQPELPGIAFRVATEHGISQPVPDLFGLVALSPIDAAIHDAYGKLHGVSTYDTLGPDWFATDLASVLGPSFGGRSLAEFVRPAPAAFVPVAHTDGALDPLTPGDVTATTIASLTEWIARGGVYAFKVKLKGKDLDWDVARLADVHEAATQALGAHQKLRIFGDLNEQGPSVAYIVELLDQLAANAPDVFAALDALEQPASRHLTDDAAFGDIAHRVPIVLDEGLTSLETIDRAVALGWNGIALKTCKTQSLMLLALAKATGMGLHISVQDLTNPGIALLQSAGLAARLPVTLPFESNARQYYPNTSAPEAAVHPEMYHLRDGRVPTAWLTGPGLGFDTGRFDRAIFRQ
jgi:L-alanine-DL-glutamate epimerase-like enolase superfamily enzyme